MSTTNQNGERYIFVGGCPRSGTTLMQNMLDSHPEICGGPEFLHLPDIFILRDELQRGVERKHISLYCDKEEINGYIAQLIDKLLLPLADKQDAPYLSEKTPVNIFHFEDLIQLYPKAKFVHVIRDPRAVIASMLKVGERAKKKGGGTKRYTKDVGLAIGFARRCYQSGFAAKLKFPDQIYEIIYEKLIDDPAGETKKLFDFLEIKWSNEILTPAAKKHAGEEAIVSGVWYDKKMFNRNPEKSSLDKWRKQLSVIDQTSINLAFENDTDLARLGYSFEKSSSLSRVRATIRTQLSPIRIRIARRLGKI